MSENPSVHMGARRANRAAEARSAASTRSQAVENVDARHGYTLEFSNQPNCHAIEYDEEEAHLTVQAESSAATLGYPVQLTKLEARLLLGMLTNPAYQSLKDYDETVKPLIVKLEAVL